jgi:hypothetical protein
MGWNQGMLILFVFMKWQPALRQREVTTGMAVAIFWTGSTT